VTISYLLDSHRISLVAVPAMGLNAEGQRVQGFAFEVAHRGTMPITGAPRRVQCSSASTVHAAACGDRFGLRDAGEIGFDAPISFP
jgi:hypothetical protein